MKRILLGLIVYGTAVVNVSYAQKPAEPSADEAAIRKTDDAYVQAFNKHDAKALADAWSPDAVYLNRASGEQVVGRAAIAEQFAVYFKEQPQVTMELSDVSIQFLSPNVAVETGSGTTLSPKAEPEITEYSAVYVRRDGQWLLDRVTDKSKEVVSSHYEQLKPLEWMIGDWVDKDDKVDVETQCKWTKNQNFITRAYTVTVGDQLETSGMQIIGWDAEAKSIRSWTFDSTGGFAEATWKQKGDNKWYIHNKGVLADGRKATMVNVVKKVDDNSFTWQTIERTAAGELLPNVDEVLIVRK